MYYIERFYFDHKSNEWRIQRFSDWGKFRTPELCEERKRKLFHKGYMKDEGPFSQYHITFDASVN